MPFSLLWRSTAAGVLAACMLSPAHAIEAAPFDGAKPQVTAPEDRQPTLPALEPEADAWTLERLRQTAADLADERFAVREQARTALERLPGGRLPDLLALAKEQSDAGVRQRLQEIAHGVFLARVLRELAEWRIGRGFLGIQWEMAAPQAGIQVLRVLPDTAAAHGGLKDGDRIVAIDGRTFEAGLTYDDVMSIWKRMAPGDPKRLKVLRGESTLTEEINVVIGEIPREYRNAEQEAARAEALWQGFQDGEVHLPRALRTRSEAPSPPPRKPLQSWPVPQPPESPREE